MSAKPNEIVTIEPARNAVTPMEMIGNALASGASIEVLEKLMALQERWEKNLGRKAFDEAMAAAKAEIPVIVKNREVDFTNKSNQRTHYRHEDLGEITRTITPILARHGLSCRFRTSQEGPMVSVTCIISHRDGHFEENTLSAGKDESGSKNNHQAIGSAITYLQRYTLKAALGLAAASDDDGKAADAGNSITDDQAMELREMIEAFGAVEAKFLEFVGAESIATIPADKYAGAVHALKAWAAENRK